MSNKHKGLSCIPELVQNALPDETLAQLQKDGHGLSFPCRSVVQMRFMRHKKDLGGSYSYSQCGGIHKAIDMAMNRNQQLRIKYRYFAGAKHAYDAVNFIQRNDKRRDQTEYSYCVAFNNGSKRGIKRFYIGAITNGRSGSINVDRQLHAYRTAKLFRYLSQIYGYDEELNAWFKPWKEIRLYTHDRAYFPWSETHSSLFD